MIAKRLSLIEGDILYITSTDLTQDDVAELIKGINIAKKEPRVFAVIHIPGGDFSDISLLNEKDMNKAGWYKHLEESKHE